MAWSEDRGPVCGSLAQTVGELTALSAGPSSAHQGFRRGIINSNETLVKQIRSFPCDAFRIAPFRSYSAQIDLTQKT